MAYRMVSGMDATIVIGIEAGKEASVSDTIMLSGNRCFDWN